MDKRTRIGGFSIHVTDEDGSVQCWVEQGDCCSSLAKAEHTGEIEDLSGRTHTPIPVPEDTLDNIREWAESHGY